jgi:hypothetical protein
VEEINALETDTAHNNSTENEIRMHLRRKYPTVFAEGLGCLKEVQAKLKLKP